MPYYGHNGKTNGSCKQLALYKQQTLNHPIKIHNICYYVIITRRTYCFL